MAGGFDPALLLQRGLRLHQAGKPAEALKLYLLAVEAAPDSFDGLHLASVAAYESGDLAQALALVERALALNEGNAHAHNNRGSMLRDLHRFDEALAAYDLAIALQPEVAEFHYNRGNVLADLDQPELAVASYDHAIAFRPDYAEALNNRGNALRVLGRLEAALASYDAAIGLRANHAEAHSNRGTILTQLGRFHEALASFETATALQPGVLDAQLGLLHTLRGLKRFRAALDVADIVVADHPDSIEASLARAAMLLELHRVAEAIEVYDGLIARHPGTAAAYFNRGVALVELKRYPEALGDFDRAIGLEPGFAGLLEPHGAAMTVGLWSNFANRAAAIKAAVLDGRDDLPTFWLLATFDDPALHRRAAETWQKRLWRTEDLGPLALRPRRDRLRIGYFSSDFRNHAMGFLIAGLFERHDRSSVELYGFAFGPRADDSMQHRIGGAFDHFIDVRRNSAPEIAALARDLEIDIAVDLNGYTTHARSEIFVHRAAPIQVSYLGYPGTMGGAGMDYVIADHTLVQPGDGEHYTEKVVFMPHAYQVNDAARRIGEQKLTRASAGLPENAFVFCCFNNNFKILPETFDSWMRILLQVPGSVLWLLEDNPWVSGNLRREAGARGVDPARLVFGGRLPLDEHLARHRLADLFLDTLPYNAHTTTSDALWAGLPVLTLPGKSFAARVAASLLKAIGLPELIASSREHYEDLAVALATNPARLAALKEKLARNRLTHPLFDTALFARHLESAYWQMYDRYQAGLPPADIIVAP